MNPNSNDSYVQNYYEDDYYEVDNFQDTCGDFSNLQVPNARLYPEGYESNPIENPVCSCLQSTEYCYNYPATYRPKTHYSAAKSTNQQRRNRYSTYSDSVQNACLTHDTALPFRDPYDLQTCYEDYYYEQHQDKVHTYRLHQNCSSYNAGCQELPGDGGAVRAARKKYPVTVKTPKYVSKNSTLPNVSKRASVLCVPVITQPDPALNRKRSKTSQMVNNNKKSAAMANKNSPANTYSAHKMNSEGDVKTCPNPENFDQFLDHYENRVLLNPGGTEMDDVTFKEFAKFMKPKVPSSVKLRQEKSLKPQMKLSLDKLLNRLQKCETLDVQSDGDSAIKSSSSQKGVKGDKNKGNVNKVDSFTYDSLTKKRTPMQPSKADEAVLNRNEESMNELLDCLEDKQKIVKTMDDHGALDLHKSKSYIVDLIDRALSKELGTVPREPLVFPDLTPNKAVAAINRHQQSAPKQLCYEVTAALTDSIVSNASAPPIDGFNSAPEPSTSQNVVQQKPSEDSYIKQLKQLRWGHIRHIQHEARKLADLEEFLEKCGEIEY